MGIGGGGYAHAKKLSKPDRGQLKLNINVN